MNMILIERSELAPDGRATLSDDRAVHLCTVLKAVVGQTVRVGMVNGPRGSGTVERMDGHVITLACVFDAECPPRPVVDLLLALPRPKVLRRLWSPLAQLGVGRIILANTWKVERNYFDTHMLDAATYRPLLLEGLQQAQDTWMPEVSIHKRFKVLVEDELESLCPAGRRLVADPGATVPMRAAVENADGRVLLAIGPEGGWTRYELDLLAARNFLPVGMGFGTLRSDVACIAALTLLLDALRVPARRGRVPEGDGS